MPLDGYQLKHVPSEVGGNFVLDENVIRELPAGCNVCQASSYGTAAWTRAARIDVLLSDGSPKSFFLKCATEDLGRTMMESEFHSMCAIHQCLPDFVPKPLAWGKFEANAPDTYFFLADFLDLDMDLPDPVDFCSTLAELHSVSQSPTGMFGFSMSTCHGPLWQNTEWHDNWCAYFTRLLDQFFARWVDQFGPDPDFDITFQALRDVATPQILGPLQAEGRKLKPSLIHGDLWEENSATNLATDQPVVFDPAVMYAHNEFELGMWRRDVVRFGKSYVRQYMRYSPPSEPYEQWDDRHRLYSLKYDFAHGIMFPGTMLSQKQLILDNMQYLNNKYPSRDRREPPGSETLHNKSDEA